MRVIDSVTHGLDRSGAAQYLSAAARPIAYLDFETVAPAAPVWDGCTPRQPVAVQLSCHVEHGAGKLTHLAWLAEGPDDPRPALAAALVKACRGAKAVLVYTGLRAREDPEPGRSGARPAGRLARSRCSPRGPRQDRTGHVYHPEFNGSFSLKDVLPALVPELSYDDLEVNDGSVASALLHRMLLRGDPATPAERAALRANLLAYCKMDTWAYGEAGGAVKGAGGSFPLS